MISTFLTDAEFESKISDGTFRFVAASMPIRHDGYGFSLSPTAVDLTKYAKSPVVLWDHTPSRLPIGRGRPFTENGVLYADVVFDTADPFAAEVARKYADGFLFAVSIGATVPNLKLRDDGNPADDQRWVLQEISACALPRDPGATLINNRMGGWQ